MVKKMTPPPPPLLHLPIMLGSRVRIPAVYLSKEVSGTVAGISSLGIMFHYIVILDEPHVFEDQTHAAISVVGTQLMNEAGSYEWRLPL